MFSSAIIGTLFFVLMWVVASLVIGEYVAGKYETREEKKQNKE